MNELEIKKDNKTFEDIKHFDENRMEYWYARELQKVLDYKEWRKFENVINKAIESCKNSNISTADHFVEVDKTIKMPKGAKNFDKFHNSGYKGLYNGETADDIAKRKGLRYREDINKKQSLYKITNAF